eukprot:TRINITY_DN3116_c0_g1_i3.p3 TRINITY_DN3116_c0_g1~~TRINITY_DN3116_c0_g1_i3.p3  ORF type:complete len:164 (+),score=7.19 TRINITY_DN3116_c0_g1_i3:212-703(+)
MMLLFTTQVQMVLTNVELKSRQLEMETFAIFMLYVRSGSNGYPLNRECDGTGCVKAPDFPRAINICWYERDEYCPEIQALSDEFCTDSGVANAAAQLRHAIANDRCYCGTVIDSRPVGVPAISSNITSAPFPTRFPSTISSNITSVPFPARFPSTTFPQIMLP